MAGPDQNFGFLLADATRMLRAELDRRIAESGLGLTAGDGRTLVHVERAGDVRQSVLAERMGVEAMTLSGSLDRLEARGLVVRRPDPDDRRAKIVELTSEGVSVLKRIDPMGAALRSEAAAGIDPGDWAVFITTLGRVRDNLAAMRESARKDSAA